MITGSRASFLDFSVNYFFNDFVIEFSVHRPDRQPGRYHARTAAGPPRSGQSFGL